MVFPILDAKEIKSNLPESKKKIIYQKNSFFGNNINCEKIVFEATSKVFGARPRHQLLREEHPRRKKKDESQPRRPLRDGNYIGGKTSKLRFYNLETY